MNFFTCCVLLLFVSCRALTVPSLPSIPLPAPLCWARSPASNSLGISSTSDPNQFISITFTPPPSVASHNLIKACCPKRLARSEVKVLDCTLGLGSDAHLLLSAGCEVLGCERDPRGKTRVCEGEDSEDNEERPTRSERRVGSYFSLRLPFPC